MYDQPVVKESHVVILCEMLVCSFLLALASWVRIPFYPVAFTAHTLLLFLFALTRKPKAAAGSALFYLLWATLGLPVFGGGANPLWFTGKAAGYLIAFPAAAWLTAELVKKVRPALAVAAGQLLIYVCGFLWLIPFVGIEMAFTRGVLIFLPAAIVKNGAVVAMAQWMNKSEEP